jgi:hypothetical protein
MTYDTAVIVGSLRRDSWMPTSLVLADPQALATFRRLAGTARDPHQCWQATQI